MGNWVRDRWDLRQKVTQEATASGSDGFLADEKEESHCILVVADITSYTKTALQGSL